MKRFLKPFLASIVVPIGFYPLYKRSYTKPLTEKEQALLTQLSPVKLDTLYTHYNEIIIGGSTGLRIFTDHLQTMKPFTVSDTDIFLTTTNQNIETDKQKINTCYPSNDLQTLTQGYSDDESFAPSIAGTISTQFSNHNTQFVMTNSNANGASLQKQFESMTDLPVFINYNRGKPYFFVRSRFHGILAHFGILTSLDGHERIAKYTQKGFSVLSNLNV